MDTRAGLRPARGGHAGQAYTGHLFTQTLAELGARHLRIPPYTPRWNGKIERFFGTLEDEWGTRPRLAKLGHPRPRPVIVPALLQPLPAALGRWCRPPITRLQQLRGQDS